MLNETSRLDDLRNDFLDGSTQSMPIAGILFWAFIAVAALRLAPIQLEYVVGFGSGMIFPLGLLIDRIRGKEKRASSPGNPVFQLFMQSLTMVVLLWPMVILAGIVSHNADLVVLGAAILMGIIWIPYGWAAADPVGLHHAIARCILSYAAFVFVPSPYKASAISVVVVLCYLYSFVRMRKGSGDRLRKSVAL